MWSGPRGVAGAARSASVRDTRTR